MSEKAESSYCSDICSSKGGTEFVDCVLSEYKPIIGLLRFFVKIGRLDIVDRFAGSCGPDAVEVLKDALDIVDRLLMRARKFDDKLACEWGKVRGDEAEEKLYRLRGAKIAEVGGEKYWYVECPERPSRSVIEKFLCELYADKAKEVINIITSSALGR
ncbi:MAG: hypothetical protein GXO26_09895 [Crenarchaeota archaeon]|nr:hypothetical protein [Thermoproteota archaeon]